MDPKCAWKSCSEPIESEIELCSSKCFEDFPSCSHNVRLWQDNPYSLCKKHIIEAQTKPNDECCKRKINNDDLPVKKRRDFFVTKMNDDAFKIVDDFESTLKDLFDGQDMDKIYTGIINEFVESVKVSMDLVRNKDLYYHQKEEWDLNHHHKTRAEILNAMKKFNINYNYQDENTSADSLLQKERILGSFMRINNILDDFENKVKEWFEYYI